MERFHQGLRRELLNDHPPFESVLAVQAAIDTWVTEYNPDRPHQGIYDHYPITRFTAGRPDTAHNDALPLRVPAILTAADDPAADEPAVGPADDEARDNTTAPPTGRAYQGGPVEFERIVPTSGNLGVRGKQFWLGPARVGQRITFWADHQLIHLLAGGTRIKTVRSHLSSADLAALAARGSRPAGPSPMPPLDPDTTALEVDRTVNRGEVITLGQQVVFIAELLAGRRVGVQTEPTLLLVFDPRDCPDPGTAAHPPQPTDLDPGPARPERPPRRTTTTAPHRTGHRPTPRVGLRSDHRRQPTDRLGRAHTGAVVIVHVSDSTLTVECPDGQQRTYRRATAQPVRSIKAYKPRTTHVS